MQPFQAPEIQPVPFVVNTQIVAMADGTRAIAFTIADVTGSKTVFMPPDFGKACSENLANAAREAGGGIIIANGAMPPVNGQG